MQTTKPLPKRCKFYAACQNAPDQFAQHSHLGIVAVCSRCRKNNEYLSSVPTTIPVPDNPQHVHNLCSLELLEQQGFKGPDASLNISLTEYGFAWRKIEEDKVPSLLIIYRHPYLDHSFDRCTFPMDTDVEKEWDWVKWADFLKCGGFSKNSFKVKREGLLTAEEIDERQEEGEHIMRRDRKPDFANLPLEDQIYAIYSQHGSSETFGESYWEGFKIEGLDWE